MLRSLIESFVHDDDGKSSTVRPETASSIPNTMRNRHKDEHGSHGLVSSDESDSEDEDEVANDLLVQFPAYGTESQAQSNNNLNQTADWLLGGTANIPSQQQLLQQKQEAEAAMTTVPLIEENPSKAISSSPELSLVNKEWDDDEQRLWRHTPEPPNKPSNLHSESTESQIGRFLVVEEKGQDLMDDPAKNWIMAYYFHTGVTPNIEMTRPHPMFDRGPTIGLSHSLPRSAFSSPEVSALSAIIPTHRISIEQEADDQGLEVVDKMLPMRQPFAPTASSLDLHQDPLVLTEEDRQHWMPDRLCKHCYACDTAFTVFRRRHHCRICGQVFCNSCSGHFVPASQPQQNPPSGMTPRAHQVNRTMLRACKMCFEQVSERQQLMESEEDIGRRRRKKDDILVSPQIPPQSLEQQHKNTVSPALQEQLDRNDSVLHNLNKRRQPMNQQEALERDEKEQASVLLQEQHKSEKMQIQQETASSGGLLAHLTPEQSIFAKRLTKATSSGSLAALSHETSHSHSNVAPNSTNPKSPEVEEGNRHLDLTAASHLEQMGKALLASDAPLLFSELSRKVENPKEVYQKWISKLMALATRCSLTVEPNVKKGDLLDIRPYVKVKVIPGGSYLDCAYVSGLVFRKSVSNKAMAKEIANPTIMLLSGGIEFTRTENRIASLETLMEQEGKYIEILVGKILKLKPDILMVGRAVSRRAQELLLESNVALIQYVKSSLLSRISRQTGATIISSTDHIMNQFGAHVLGRCNRFRTVVARDNEVWLDGGPLNGGKVKGKHREISKLLHNPQLPNPDRQAVLAANMLGEDIQDGQQAVKTGLAKRGVAQTYAMLEGCPKQLGCTVILRGASRSALKQVKVVFRFLVNAAYNLRLETSFMKERRVRLDPSFHVRQEHLFSSSLCVDYGSPHTSRKVRPWNGGSSNEGSQRSISGQVTAFDHQSILISSVWMTDKTQCCPAEVKGICYYSMQDVSLGQFLRDSCFNLSLKCQNPSCKKSVLDHSLSFVHNDGLINITVDHNMDEPLPANPAHTSRRSDSNNDGEDEGDDIEDPPIATWTSCKNCAKVVTAPTFISEKTWKYSFGKFLESFFYNRNAIMNSPLGSCKCNLQTSTILYFGCGRLAARFTYERVKPFGVFVRKVLPIDTTFHRNASLRQLENISMASSMLFVKFDKHIERVSREARSLYGNTGNRVDHLQTVVSELNRISSEVDHAAKTLQEKIASVSDKCSKDKDGVVSDALLRFPWFARRYLFMLTSAWNEKLSAAGQAIVAMKKLASSSTQRNDSLVGPNVVGDQNHDELNEGMRRLRQLHEVYSRYNITDITTVLPIIPGNNSKTEIEFDDDFEDPDGAIDFAESVDADVLASRRRFYHSGSNAIDYNKSHSKTHSNSRRDDSRSARESSNTSLSSSKVTPGGAVKSALTRFFNRGGRESDPYVVDLGIFSEGRPRLEPGVNGIVVPVIDDQLCTIIAYSLSSIEYSNQFQGYSKMESSNADSAASTVKLDPPAGAPSLESGAGGRKPSDPSTKTPSSHGHQFGASEKQDIERRMLVRNKSHIKHTFRDFDEKGQNLCKFVCTTYWATQFQAVRQAFLSPNGVKGSDTSAFPFPAGLDVEQAYAQSLSSAYSWAASGGKSGASFARTSDDRFVIKCISRTELQMFLESAPAYFEYLSKAFFHGLPTVLCKIVGVYQIGIHNRVTGKRSMEQVAVMQNIFYNKKISKTFDLKGSLRGRFAAQIQRAKDDHNSENANFGNDSSSHRKSRSDYGSDPDADSDLSDRDEGQATSSKNDAGTLLDGDFLEFTSGRPMPMNDRAKAVFHMSILNDTLFLSIINVLDYSILVGIDEERMELVVGIIDFMRQYDILKQMERVGKSLPMVVGSEAPTIIQPPLYKARFTNAMERYFMTVPSKWTTI